MNPTPTSGRRLHKPVGVAVALAAMALSLGASVQPASAAAKQTICSSKYTLGSVALLYKSGKDHYLKPGECVKSVPRGTRVFVEDSYRVGYDHGPYSKCRTNTGFVPYAKAKIIYFRAYPGQKCKNPFN